MFHFTLMHLRSGMNSSVHPPTLAMGSLALVWKPVSEKENSVQTSCTLFKNFVISCLWQRGWLKTDSFWLKVEMSLKEPYLQEIALLITDHWLSMIFFLKWQGIMIRMIMFSKKKSYGTLTFRQVSRLSFIKLILIWSKARSMGYTLWIDLTINGLLT